MAKGGKQPGAGRPPGQPNKATMQAREAIAAFVEGNVERLNGWLDDIAADSPQAAFDRFMSVVEYHIPKLARTEMTGKNGAAIELKDVTDVKSKVLKAIPEDQLNAILANAGDNNG